MAEPPIHVEPEGVKPELRRTGHRWIDLSIAGSAILLSVISLVVAIGNARTQQRMVAATTWPMLHYGTTNVDEGERVIAMTVANTGVGPALVKTAQLAYAGRPIRSPEELLVACCGLTPGVKARIAQEGEGGLLSSRISGVMRPGDKVSFIVMPRTEANAAVWDRLDRPLRCDARRLLLLGLRGVLALRSGHPGTEARGPLRGRPRALPMTPVAPGRNLT